jgi:hypothetical protein
VIFPEASHGNWGPCGSRITAQFLDLGTVRGLDTSCVAQQPRTQFVTRPLP